MEEKPKEKKSFPMNLMGSNEIEIKEDIIDRPVRVGKGPKAAMVLEYNRGTREIFDNGNHPRQGRRYCLKCIRYDGKRGYFCWERF